MTGTSESDANRVPSVHPVVPESPAQNYNVDPHVSLT